LASCPETLGVERLPLCNVSCEIVTPFGKRL
jgi:hypothetical protein